MNITDKLLIDATGCTAANAGLYAAHLDEACKRYEINTPVRLAAFLAQVGHESDSLSTARERWGPTPAQTRYEVRKDLGNTEPGDGRRFAGHGLIQTTGRWNHRRVTLRMRSRFGADVPDFEADPEALVQPRWAALSAADFWDDSRLNGPADEGKFIEIGRAINRGNRYSRLPANGEADRLARWTKAKRALSAHFVDTSPEPVQETPKTEHVEDTAMPPLIAALGKTLIAAFAPLAAEKIQREISRHTDRPEVAEQITDAVITAAKTATGLDDPIEAVAEARKDPQVLAQVEASVLDKLASMAPLLQQLDSMDLQRFADEEGSRAAAHARYSSDWDMTPVLVFGALGLVAGLVLLVGGIAVYQVVTKESVAPEVWAQLAGLIGFATGVCVSIFSFRFGTTRGSGAKDVLIRELSTGRPQP